MYSKIRKYLKFKTLLDTSISDNGYRTVLMKAIIILELNLTSIFGIPSSLILIMT
jgi:hypothetical protein